jgi:hypothetical protein
MTEDEKNVALTKAAEGADVAPNGAKSERSRGFKSHPRRFQLPYIESRHTQKPLNRVFVTKSDTKLRITSV